jgi:aerobic carbon-monoxide dehydrogenase medium subunit
MKLRLATPAVVIDLGSVPGLSYIRDGGGEIAIGALTRHVQLEMSSLLRLQVPLLRHAASAVGDCQIRHRGTIGGAVCHGDPAADIPAALMALRATMVLQGPQGRRSMPIDDFYLGFLETALLADAEAAPVEDAAASIAYRRHLSRVLLRRALAGEASS